MYQIYNIYLEYTQSDIIFIVDKIYSNDYIKEFDNNNRVKIHFYKNKHALLELL